MNLVWVLTVTFLIFFMHAGFAMLEAGQVRAKNVANQLTKNLLTWRSASSCSSSSGLASRPRRDRILCAGVWR
ncbi:hypothetical protein C9J85_13305 [Haloferax sp. wsp5]|nr:hypothetical protein C9J85_13305 [Haloferax sp. wsp5]